MSLREQVLSAYPVADYLSGCGVGCKKTHGSEMVSCPLHADKTPSCSVSHDKQLWKCFSCGEGGTVIDLHMRRFGMSVKDALFDLADKANIQIDEKPHKSETYEYRDQVGRPVMRVDRIEAGRKKKFRQYHERDGQEVSGIDGVSRVLYRLDKWHGGDFVALCEGEKCVHALEAMGTPATTNPGGSNGWLDAYAEMLAGKRVEIYPDGDEAGEKWLDLVMKSLEGKVTALRVIRTPKPYNDIADMVEAKGAEYAAESMQQVVEKTAWVEKGIFIDLLSSHEAYEMYAKRVRESESVGIDLGRWLPSLRSCTRPMMPGDLVVVMADTGVGKTAILANIAYSQNPLPVVFFELELSAEAMAERFVARDTGIDAREVEREVRKGARHSVSGWSHVYTCPNSRMTVADMERLIMRSELKIGRRPALVMVDYVGLVSGGAGKRYERLSEIAEELKRMARNTNTVVVIASQVKRDESRSEVGLHDAKDSGSIENSAQLVLGAWRPAPDQMTIKILKQTRMAGQCEINCRYWGNKQLIAEAHIENP